MTWLLWTCCWHAANLWCGARAQVVWERGRVPRCGTDVALVMWHW